MSRISLRVVLSCLCILVGYSIFGIYALSLRFHFDFPIEAYWLSFVFVSIPIFSEVVSWKSNPKLRLFYLLSFSIMITLQYAAVDFSPLMTSSDAVADYRLTDKIIANSHWLPFEPVGWIFGNEYRFYPVTNFVYATISMLTGIPLLFVVKYLFIIKALVVPPIIDKWFQCFFDRRVAFLATVIFVSSPGAILFPHKESFAMIFFALGLYACNQMMRARVKTRQYLSIGFISILILAMTHHLTTYILLGILTSLYLVGHVFKHQKPRYVSTQFLMFCWVIFATWAGFIAWTIVVEHQKVLFEVFFGLLMPGEVAFSELMSLNPSHERMLISIGYGITAVSAGLGFLYYVRNKKSRSAGFSAIMSSLFLLIVCASIFRFAGSQLSILVSHRAFEFGYLLIGALSALFLIHLIRSRKKLSLNLILMSAMVLMMIVGPMAGSMHPRILARLGKVVSYNALALNVWMSESDASDEYMVGDRIVQHILSGYGNITIVENPELVPGQGVAFVALPEGSKPSFLVTYVYMTDFYGIDFAEFDNSPDFQGLYSNGIINVYEINNHT